LYSIGVRKSGSPLIYWIKAYPNLTCRKHNNKISATRPMSTLDPQIIKAMPEVRSLFEDKYGRPRKRTYYIGQLQVILEGDFFPWIVYNATMQLIQQGELRHEITPTRYADKVTFVHHRKFTDIQMSTRIRNTARLIDRYSHPRVADALGKHLEGLVKAELRAQGFNIEGSHTNEYRGKKWQKTNQNLDFIAEHRSQRLQVGVEVKNTLSTPEREEIEAKIELCQYLNLTPVFAGRWMQPYLKRIHDKGGFCWIFKTQIYPLGFENLTQILWKRLRLPVNVRTDLPPKSVRSFEAWVARKIS